MIEWCVASDFLYWNNIHESCSKNKDEHASTFCPNAEAANGRCVCFG